jgi:hypothetical protein
MTDWPHASPNFWANMRAVTSVALPAVKPTTSRTGFSGQLVWAIADWPASTSRAATAQRTIECMLFPPAAVLAHGLWASGQKCS